MADIFTNISIIFISIFFESIPFLLLGSFISALIETYISNDMIASMIPKNKILGSIVGILLGFFIPACDCAVIPVTKRLLRKKVPLNVVISFMLASPIINPVVLLSTYYAFYKTDPSIFWGRIVFGILISLIIGIIISIIFGKKRVIINNIDEDIKCECHTHIEEGFEDLLESNHSIRKNAIKIFKHTGLDMYEIIRYLVLGALIASIIQVLLPRDILIVFNSNQSLSIIVLMIFAYSISLCSTSDSFIGKSLLSTFSASSVMAFLLLGPMIDIKNTIVLLGNYKKKFVITLISIIFITIFIFSLLVVNIL